MVVLLMIGTPSWAQDGAAPGPAADPRPTICYGIAFGAWQPALDWTAAGHRPPQPPRYVAPPARGRSAAEPPAPSPPSASSASTRELAPARTPGADNRDLPRGDAMHPDAMRDSSVMLFPAWWPAGVRITYEPGTHADSASAGEAMALVADARLTPPRASVRVARIPCRRR